MNKFTSKKHPLTSDAIHNRNCYTYFLQLKPTISGKIIELVPEFALILSVMNQAYDKHFPYGNLYSSCIAALEKYLDKNSKDHVLNDLILAIYHNDNHILEQGAQWLNSIGNQASPSTSMDKEIKRLIKDRSKNINHHSPYDLSSNYHKARSLFTHNFKPQHETNLPSLKNFSYKNSDEPTEYRFSTQAQRHKNHARVSTLFKRWLEINAEKSNLKQINHIYFNNLALDKKHLNIPRLKERELSLTLHELEKKSHLKILVITLPANEGLMNSQDYKITKNRLSVRSVFQELLDVAQGKQHPSGISDLFISNTARKLLFDSPENEEEKLTALLTQSFKAHDITNDFMTTAQKQAVWVHFVKYELTDYILKTIQPNSYNFSCKDAIDRGALSSTYYNLLQSFTSNKPIGKKEFERLLDAAAANVKGRGMNFHRKILWNTINSYVNANYDQLFLDHSKSWLIYWRDMNCPHSRINELIPLRWEQVMTQFNNLPQEKTLIQKNGLTLLHSIKNLDEQNTSGKRLRLEIISRTSELLHSPSSQSIPQYKKLINKLKIHSPSLYVISGLMKAFLGLILYIPSLGYSEKMFQKGYSTAKTGFFTPNRMQCSQPMIHFTLAEPSK